VEEKITGEKEPKQIIGDLLDKITKELPGRLSKDNLINLIKAAEESLNEKHVLFYFNDEGLEKKVDESGWSGRMKETKFDYLMVANTNIGGGKSDRKIRETINHEAEVMPNGSVIDTIKIVREHTAGKGEKYTGVRNVNWLRVYVPAGSEFLEAQGFEKPDDIFFKEADGNLEKDKDISAEEESTRIDEISGTKIYKEGDYTVFANWTMADPGETDVIYLKYKLPFNIFENKKEAASYSLLVQKQPGSVGVKINSDLKLPKGLNVAWQYPGNFFHPTFIKGAKEDSGWRISDPTFIKGAKEDSGWRISDTLETDKYWAAIISF
jgi:hypothetical protein